MQKGRRVTTPCVNHPGFLQPGNDPEWHTLPAAQDAIRLCHRKCPIPLEDCARQALTAGTLEGHNRQRVANGVIQAGIVCKGDHETRKALTELAYPNGDAPETFLDDADEACSVCTRDFAPDEEPTTTTTTHRAVASSPLCWACYQAANRGGTLIPFRPSTPSHCQGPCGLPLMKRGQKIPGHVRHEKGGLCAACNRAARRAEQREAA